MTRRRRPRWVAAHAARNAGRSDEADADRFAYEVVVLRQLEQDAMLWQTPALSLTAQAFLFTIALSPDASRPAQLVASGLAVIIAVCSVHLMAKHEWLSQVDRHKMRQLETRLCLPPIAERGWARSMTDENGEPDRKPLAARGRSYHVWQLGMSIFGVTAAAVFAVTLLREYPGFVEVLR